MGLDFRTEGIPWQEDINFDLRAHWSYSGFHAFRMRLAQSIGLAVPGDEPIDWAEQPLRALLAHSDCDGILTPQECKVVGPALATAVWGWKPVDDYDRINAIKLAYQMSVCVVMNRNLEFC